MIIGYGILTRGNISWKEAPAVAKPKKPNRNPTTRRPAYRSVRAEGMVKKTKMAKVAM
jgi:hypothetical protein